MADPWLVADIGGTTTRIGFATAAGLDRDSVARVPNDGALDAYDLILDYLGGQDVVPKAICAGIAGPVRDGRARLTNRDWCIDSSRLSRVTGAGHVHLINDLQAQAHALAALSLPSITPLFGAATPLPRHGPRLVLGLGTGFIISVAHDLGGALFVPAAEAGHSRLPHIPDFAPLVARIGVAHHPVEALLSGPGLSRLHAALGHPVLSPADILAAMSAGAPDTDATRDVFARLLGHVAGDFGLIHMATAGVFLIGGLARAIAPHLDAIAFRAAFEDKGPYAGIMQAIPVSLITDDDAALLGCACVLAYRL